MAIREAVEADRKRVVALWDECGLTRPWNDPSDDFERALTNPTSAVLVDDDRDRGGIVATAMVGYDGHRGWLYYVATVLDVRGSGRGRAIVAAAERWLGERDCPKVMLMVRRSNSTALGFYETIDYQRSDAVLLERWLT